ncbi:MAG: MFS transporter [Pirellulales bacterium]
MALIAALLGWMFDGAEMGVFSLVARPAIKDLLGPQREAEIALWIGVITAIFLVGAATGGVIFGWLGDRVGRVRAMTLSVLTYALFTSLCGLVNHPVQLGLLRFVAALGMGGEWSLGVALVMEVWPNRSRAFMAGLIGAAANVGYLLVGMVGIALATVIARLESLMLTLGLPVPWVERLVANDGWRIMMLLGILPAILTFLIRLFVPESPRWSQEQQKGHTSHWAATDLWGVLIGLLGPIGMVYLYARGDRPAWMLIIGTVLGIALAVCGYTYPVYRFLQRQREAGIVRDAGEASATVRRMLLAAALSGVALLGTWGATQQAPSWVDKLTEADRQAGLVRHAKEYTLIWLSAGAVVGTIAAALMGDWLGRRVTYFLLCVAALGSVLLLFHGNDRYGTKLLFCTFITGACTASFYGWLPLYLPELFRTGVRATGQGFAFNFGRVLAAVGTFQLGGLVKHFADGLTLGPLQLAGGYPSACTLLSTIYFVGMVLIWFAPENRSRELPD